MRPLTADDAVVEEQWATGPRILEAALAAADMGPWRYSFHDHLLWCSPRAQQLYGLDEPSFVHDEEGVRRLLHPDDVPRMWAAVEAAVRPEGEGRYAVEYRVARRDGGWRWLRVWGLATFAGDGPTRVPLMLAGASRDITEQKRAEAFHHAQKRALELIVQGASLSYVLTHLTRVVEEQADDRVIASILLLDRHGRLQHGAAPSLPDSYNAAIDGLPALADFGTCSGAAATGRVVITPDIDAAAGWQSIKHLPLALGLRGAWSQPITARDGRVLGTFGTYFRDVREPTAQERQSVELLASVAALAIERAQSEEALREADRRKDEFLATLSHELRNPLAPLRTALHMIRMPGAELHRSRLLDTMDRQVDQLVRLVGDLLEVSRISRGALELQRHPVLLTTVVALAIETSQPLCQAAGHRLSVSLPDEPIWIDGDRVRLAQILTNLVNNAAKYTEPGGRISVGTRVDDGHVEIQVVDSGVGIDAGVLPGLFELFVRGSGADRQHREGLGIGLALARRLAEMHGGTLQGTSEGPGRGSAFTVRLPVVPAPGASPASTPAAAHRPLTQRVLIVDDNVDAAAMTALLLRDLGCETYEAHDGATAIQAAAATAPDVVLLDIGLPDMTGHEVCRRLRTGAQGRAMLVVAVSGWGQSADVERSASSGFDAHLVKPVSPDHLVALLRSRAAD